MKKHGLLLTVLILALLLTFTVQAETVGRTVSIVLDENPTTGYAWSYSANPEGILREVSSEYAQDAGTENMMGAGGKHTWVFESIGQGDTLLRFTYARPTETGVLPAREVFFLLRTDEMLNAAQRGSIEASGSYVFISLAENPTTGYQWLAVQSAEGVLKLEGDEYLQDNAFEGSVGAGGTHTWRFAAVAAGEVTLSFSLARSFEPGAVDQLRLTIAVDTGLNATLKAVE
jgi:predicted secreted protein